ncbi:hypothetical protein [Campylobacter insulaenigrae]|uniref:hypothetical protein n=1 Tax=Campylobacter insulaenigrae TaxID=260714 RepID=UPI0021523834|nr:hypothetical protein [Campylobacter insulaenigrae]MCR6572335.1 hypothetical protein [Campylobacter insulaenigrae]MCR6581716.1 hypothetical protein [Campylobacter insulaenigrae]
MNKEIKKHLDNPNLRGMVTTQEMLSFPKVAKNVEAKYNPQQQGYDWSVKANDENILKYGERDFGKGHRLLTAHSKTERGERSHPHRQINDSNFHNSVENIIPQENKPINDFKAKFKEFITKNKNYISNQRTGVKRVFIVLNVLDY